MGRRKLTERDIESQESKINTRERSARGNETRVMEGIEFCKEGYVFDDVEGGMFMEDTSCTKKVYGLELNKIE
jgi:hypothetical protein